MMFRCKRIQAAIYRSETGTVPPGVAEHAAACPECRQILQACLAVQQLIRLKRHEQPQAEATERCLLALHGRLVEWEQRKHLQAAQEDPPALTGWRYGWAAALMALLAFNLMAARQTPSLQSNLAQMPSPYQGVPMQLASSNHQFRFEASSGLLGPSPASLRTPSRGHSVLTAFEE